MKDVNEAAATGRLGDDPVLRYAKNGTAFTTFSIACSDDYFDKENKSWVERVNWLNFVCYTAQAERIAQKYKKGNWIYVNFSIRNNNRTDESGKRIYGDDFLVNYVIAPPGSNNSQQSTPDRQESRQAPAATQSYPEEPPF